MNNIDIQEIHKETFQPVFYTIAGSHLSGMNVETSDYDFIGASIETPDCVIGGKTFEQYEWKRPDLNAEGVTYSLRKFMSLLQGCNPTILCTVFSPYATDMIGLTDPILHERIASRKAAYKFIGYMLSQMRRLHTQKGMHVTRAELIDKYKFDVKYASHVIRLGYQGIEYLTSGKITLPMKSYQVDQLLAIRNGLVSYEEFQSMADRTLDILKSVEGLSKLPKEPDYDFINDWVVKAYFKKWKSDGII